MKFRELGRLDGDLLIFGGPYSNLHALQALAQIAADYPAQNVICTGDVVAYCADPAACVALIRSRGWTVVAGNCERQLQAEADDCGCGFEDGSVCDLLSRDWYAFAKARMSSSDRAWMASLPDGVIFENRGQRHAVIHGGMTDLAAFIWPTCPPQVFEAEVAAIGTPVDVVIGGHCGIAFEKQVAGVTWFNAGVIGMPPNDGSPQTRYGKLSEYGFSVELLDYDYQGAATAMEEAGLTGGYGDALVSGNWPSEQILPIALRHKSVGIEPSG